MDEMIKKAVQALVDNPLLNEIELTDPCGIKVRVVRNPPTIWYYTAPWSAPVEYKTGG